VLSSILDYIDIPSWRADRLRALLARATLLSRPLFGFARMKREDLEK